MGCGLKFPNTLFNGGFSSVETLGFTVVNVSVDNVLWWSYREWWIGKEEDTVYFKAIYQHNGIEEKPR